ncbi:phosphonate metabolism protein PhnP [Catenovulum sp. SM1970]|uniref:phosphonate metabolism protein PhnP n=1 Tax=Marinifaba aquimaris TaxID=2741323 RepID=UPI001573E164|nr:phosphonate metabolism protein PhnP [Marinifaba aquimaris]NTS78868.1 phosphonate metabolism protein PhnP [Marinifaba aquimaris]
MKVTLLGTGAAGGVPVFGCQCHICLSAKITPSLRRNPACALIELDGAAYLIDAGIMDIGERFESSFLNAIFLTHFHPDHVQGLFHIRWGSGFRIPIFCPPDKEGCADLYKNPGILDFRQLKKFEPLDIDELRVTPLPLIHSKLTYGYLFTNAGTSMAYLTDTKGLPPAVTDYLNAIVLDCLIIDTTSPPTVENRNHNNYNDTLAIHESIRPKKTVLTHISHDLDNWLNENNTSLPENMLIGRDNMMIKI